MDIRPLDAPFGVEFLGVTTRTIADRDSLRAFHEALDAHALVVFRDLEIAAAEHVELLSTLGDPLIENPSGRAYQFVSNVHDEGILGDEEFAFHSDHAFMPDPIEVISLCAVELPASGTTTRFVNGVKAAAALPRELHDRVVNRSARHIIDPMSQSGVVRISESGPLSDECPHSIHPILWEGTRGGMPVLYVSEQQTDRVEGLPVEEGRALVKALFDHLYSGPFTYVHEWRPRDLLVWDNRALQHARAPVEPGTRRTLRRVSVGGSSAYAYFEGSRPGFGQPEEAGRARHEGA